MAEIVKNCETGKENMNKPYQIPEIGDHYHVKRSDNTLHAAEVIQKRQNDDGNQEIYVHYEGYDRRLDEWVELDR